MCFITFRNGVATLMLRVNGRIASTLEAVASVSADRRVQGSRAALEPHRVGDLARAPRQVVFAYGLDRCRVVEAALVVGQGLRRASAAGRLDTRKGSD
jgi:hypothetical protein